MPVSRTTPFHPTLAAPLVGRVRTEDQPAGTGLPFKLEGVALRPKYWHTHLHSWSGCVDAAATPEADANAGSSTAGKKKRQAKKKSAKADALALDVPVSLNINVLVDRVSEAKATLYD